MLKKQKSRLLSGLGEKPTYTAGEELCNRQHVIVQERHDAALRTIRLRISAFSVSEQKDILVKSNGIIHAQAFLEVCRHVVRIVDSFGAGMVIVKNDINGNIRTLERISKTRARGISDDLYELVKSDSPSAHVGLRHHNSINEEGSSAAWIALLWLYRAMDFMFKILKNVIDMEKDEESIAHAISTAYRESLQPHHGWIAQHAFQVAFNFLPTKSVFFSAIIHCQQNPKNNVVAEETKIRDAISFGVLKTEISLFLADFSPILKDVNYFLENINNTHDDVVVGIS